MRVFKKRKKNATGIRILSIENSLKFSQVESQPSNMRESEN